MSSFVRDNIEAFAVAIAMALVIRHYSVEAFRIPTGSMMPALYGDGVDDRTHQPRHGDRILVDKFAWMRGSPERYQVAVFQYPLERTTNFIKRIAGLPGEWIAIADGDIWTSRDGDTWSIARKPAALRRELWIPYWPVPPDNASGFSDDPCWTGGDAWTVEGETFSVDAEEAGSQLTFNRDVLVYPEVDHSGGSQRGSPRVGDIRFLAEVEVERAGEIEFLIEEHGVTHRLVLGADESFLEVGGPEPARRAIDFRLEAGDSFDVSFANVDLSLVADVDGTEHVLEFPDVPDAPPGRAPEFNGMARLSGTNGFSLVAKGTKASFESVRLERDLHYLRERNDDGYAQWHVPPGHYFMLGDNTNYSKDSRAWNLYRIVLDDGTEIAWEAKEDSGNPTVYDIPAEGSNEEFVIPLDSQGLVRRIPRSRIASWEKETEAPFVPADHLIGRAFGVFWPIYAPPLYRGPTRVQRIR